MKAKLFPRYHIHYDFLTSDEQAILLEWTLGNEKNFVPTTIAANKVDPERRFSLGLRDLGSSSAPIRERMRSLVPVWIESLGISGFSIAKIELELVAHHDGAFFKPHIDTVTGKSRNQASHRMLSCVYYFYREPKGFDGGTLRLLPLSKDPDGAVEIEPTQNSFVVFPSWMPHEVRPVFCLSTNFGDSRFAVNCWVHSDSPKLA